jgi:hypothetical protein
LSDNQPVIGAPKVEVDQFMDVAAMQQAKNFRHDQAGSDRTDEPRAALQCSTATKARWWRSESGKLVHFS